MPTLQDKLSASLAALKKLQDQGIVAIQTKNMTRTHRERLAKNGFIKEVMKGWYISIRPEEPSGERARPGMPHSGAFAVIILNQGLAVNGVFPLNNHCTSITETGTLINFPNNAIEARAALSMISDASEILHKLLDGGHSTVAGRLAGAFRNIGRDIIADNIIEAMRTAGDTITENDPFEEKTVIIFSESGLSPYANRMRMYWADMRGIVVKNFPRAPLLQRTTDEYLKQVDEIYVTDAYHSLSIEGYRVSEGLRELGSGNQP